MDKQKLKCKCQIVVSDMLSNGIESCYFVPTSAVNNKTMIWYNTNQKRFYKNRTMQTLFNN